MVDRKDPLSVTRQCALLDLPRSTFYHVPKPVSDKELELMALIDRCHLKHPFYGSRRIRDWLEDQGYRVNRKKVQRLMRTMDLAVQYPKRNLSLANQAHKVYPYLLRDLVVDRPNQVWATDVTYVPMARGFVYLVAIMDWYSRRVSSWQASNAMDRKGRWVENVVVERVWRSVKDEDAYPRACESPAALRAGLGPCFDFYNSKRRHQALERRTRDSVYFEAAALPLAA